MSRKTQQSPCAVHSHLHVVNPSSDAPSVQGVCIYFHSRVVCPLCRLLGRIMRSRAAACRHTWFTSKMSFTNKMLFDRTRSSAVRSPPRRLLGGGKLCGALRAASGHAHQ